MSANRVPSPTERTPSITPQLIGPTDSLTLATSHPSSMERKALGFFLALLVWNDVLSCSTQKKAPLGAEAYRKLLADEEFTQTFRDITGCGSWILVTILDATFLEIWKRDQEAQGNLSIRELVSRAEKIESVLEQGIEKLSTILQSNPPVADAVSYKNGHSDHLNHVQTYIFAHTVLIHLHTIVSGPWPGVPEIQQTVDRAISAWKLCPSSTNLKALAWPYCVSASLSVGSQRDMFRGLILEASSKEPTLGNLVGLKSVVEECWRSFDGRASDRDASCDWKDVMQRLNLSILFV
jgi:C6 transcription factor Pro1